MVNINAAHKDKGKSFTQCKKGKKYVVWYKLSPPWCFKYTIMCDHIPVVSKLHHVE